jgi:parvulin-like peptidyl-prolyl isomerase
MQNHLRYSVSIWAVIFFLITPLGAHGSDPQPGTTHESDTASLPAMPTPEKFVSLKIPLFSTHFAETPVALVNDEPITLGELAEALGPLRALDTKQEAVYQSVLQRIIRSRLILQEAINIGLNETDTMKNQIENFKIKTLQQELIKNHLQGLVPDPADVEDVYQQLSREVQLYSLTFELGADAQLFLDETQDGDFDQLANKYIEAGKAMAEKGDQYLKIKDLLPQVGQQVYSMKKGSVSKVFRTEKGFLLFQLTDTRFVEDPTVEKQAVRIVLDTLKKQKAMEYSNTLTDKYVTFDDALYEQLDFDTSLEELLKDDRVLATVKGEEPVIITVGDLAAKLQLNFFHGADKAQKLKMINERKDSTISNMLFRHTSEREAHHLGLDQTEDFKRKVAAFERSTLFSAFMDKVILPDVRITSEDVRTYYDEHIDEYSSPAMLRMNSLVFHNQQDAESALDKLRKGADFNWVSANASGFVDPDAEGVLPFDEKLLSLTSLPNDLQESARGANKGDSLFYAASEGDYYYVLVIKEVFPPEPQPYEQARNAVSRTVFDQKARELLDEWITKLKEYYPTQVFLIDQG